jgi:glutathione peroxidase
MGTSKAQRPSPSDLLFPQYENGTAILKNGIKMNGQFNYSIVTRQIQYIEDSVIMTFAEPGNVSQVIIAGRVFEFTPKNGILERVPVGEGAYYVEWEPKWVSVGKKVGLGHYAQSYSTTSYKTSETGTTSAPRYTYNEGMVAFLKSTYYMKKDGKFRRFDSASSLAKAIGCCKKELKDFVKKENIRFDNPEDVHRMMMTFLIENRSKSTIYSFTVKTIDGDDFPLFNLKGKKIMIVNVASKCGLTPQYAQLQELYEQYKDNNFVIVGFPANNFGAQEPGANEEIKAFCTSNYGVTFPMMAKISVKGDDIAPLYRWLTTKEANGVADAEVTWNFQKFLIDENGRWVKSIEPKESPQSEEIIKWIIGN